MSAGSDLIAAERQRQVEAEGWTAEHDAVHREGDLVRAAICYALGRTNLTIGGVYLWPWEAGWWKPTPDDRVRELVKAGALIAAEIDRLSTEAAHRPLTPKSPSPNMSEGDEFQFEAEFQCALEIATRLDREAQSIDTTSLLAHLAVIAQDEYGYCDCPRCDRQTFDRGSCSLCANVGWLNENGERFSFSPAGRLSAGDEEA